MIVAADLRNFLIDFFWQNAAPESFQLKLIFLESPVPKELKLINYKYLDFLVKKKMNFYLL